MPVFCQEMIAGILLFILGGFAMALADSVSGLPGRNGRVLLGFRDRFAASFDALVHGARDAKKRELFSGGVDKKELLR